MSDKNLSFANLDDLNEYAADVPVYSFKGQQGARPTFTVSPTIGMALDLMPKPDPQVKFPNNRELNVAHAKAWGDYWERTEEAWGCPPGLVSVRGDFDRQFEPHASANGCTLGTLNIPRDFPEIAEILDMQHRLYGWMLKRKELAERLRETQDLHAAAKRLEDHAMAHTYAQKLEHLEAQIKRFHTETITIEIKVISEKEHRELFAKIADSALAINASQIVDYDTTQTLNMVVHEVSQKSPLLKDRVLWTKTKPGGHDAAFVSASGLANLVRPRATGSVVGRIKEPKNEALRPHQAELASWTLRFLEALTLGFEDISALQDGETTAEELRAGSLLGSPTIQRVLAGVYNELTTSGDILSTAKPLAPRMTQKEVVEFFQRLSPHMGLPLEDEWFSTGVFPAPAEGKETRAPSSRNQDLTKLVKVMTAWAMGEGFPWED